MSAVDDWPMKSKHYNTDWEKCMDLKGDSVEK